MEWAMGPLVVWLKVVGRLAFAVGVVIAAAADDDDDAAAVWRALLEVDGDGADLLRVKCYADAFWGDGEGEGKAEGGGRLAKLWVDGEGSVCWWWLSV